VYFRLFRIRSYELRLRFVRGFWLAIFAGHS